MVFLFRLPVDGGVQSLAKAYSAALLGDSKNVNGGGYLTYRFPGTYNTKSNHTAEVRWLVVTDRELPTAPRLWADIHGRKPHRFGVRVTNQKDYNFIKETSDGQVTKPFNLRMISLPEMDFDEGHDHVRLHGVESINCPGMKKVLSAFDSYELWSTVRSPSSLDIICTHDLESPAEPTAPSSLDIICTPCTDSAKEVKTDKIREPCQGEIPKSQLKLGRAKHWEQFLRIVVTAPHLDKHGRISQAAIAKVLGLSSHVPVQRMIIKLKVKGLLKEVPYDDGRGAIVGVRSKQYKASGELLRLHREYYKNHKSRFEGAIDYLEREYPQEQGFTNSHIPHWVNLLADVGLDVDEIIGTVQGYNRGRRSNSEIAKCCRWYFKKINTTSRTGGMRDGRSPF